MTLVSWCLLQSARNADQVLPISMGAHPGYQCLFSSVGDARSSSLGDFSPSMQCLSLTQVQGTLPKCCLSQSARTVDIKWRRLLFGQVWGGIEVGEGGWGLGVPFLCWRILFPLLKKERLITPQCRTPLTSAKVTSTQFSKYSHKIIYYLIFAKKNLNHKKIPKMKK